MFGTRRADIDVRIARLEERQESDRRLRTFLVDDLHRRIDAAGAQFVDAKLYEERHDSLLAELQKVRTEMYDIKATDRATRRSVVTMIAVAAIGLPMVIAFIEFIK